MGGAGEGGGQGTLKAIVIMVTGIYCLLCACYFVRWLINPFISLTPLNNPGR